MKDTRPVSFLCLSEFPKYARLDKRVEFFKRYFYILALSPFALVLFVSFALFSSDYVPSSRLRSYPSRPLVLVSLSSLYPALRFGQRLRFVWIAEVNH